MMKRYTLELDAFEIGCFAGLLLARERDREESNPVLVHLRHRLADLAKQIYADDREAETAETAADLMAQRTEQKP